MSALPETPYAEYWPDAWRYAFLMAGSAEAADAAILTVVPKAAERLTQMRDARQAKRWLFSNLRERCRTPVVVPTQAAEAPVTPPESDPAANPQACQRAGQMAELFARLPEEERCALALFYLRRFDPAELAEVMDLSPLALGQLLEAARRLLDRHKDLRASLLSPAAPSQDEAGSPEAG